MPKAWQVVASVWLGLTGPVALAQSNSSAADEEAMARARRQAENPMRRILEAGRITIRRRALAETPDTDTAPPVEPAVATGRTPMAGVSPAVAASAAQAPGEQVPPAIRVTVEPILPAVAQRSAPEASQALPLPVSTPTLAKPATSALSLPPAAPRTGGPGHDGAGRLPPAGTVPLQQAMVFKTMEWAPDPQPAPAGAAVTAGPEPVEAAVLDRSAAPSPAQPQLPALRSFVEPALTDRLRDELGRVDVVTVELALNADGSVQDAEVLTRVPAGVRRAIQSALLQWRYDALPGPATHRVEVAFER